MSAYREAYTSKLTNFWPNSSIQQYNLTKEHSSNKSQEN